MGTGNKTLLCLLTIVFCLAHKVSATLEIPDKLGLISNVGKLKVAQTIDKVHISVTVLVNTSLTDYLAGTQKIREIVFTPRNFEKLKANPNSTIPFYNIFFPGSLALDRMDKDFALMTMYVDPTVTSKPKYDCHSYLADPGLATFYNLATSLEWALAPLSENWSVADLAKPTVKQQLTDFLHDAQLDLINVGKQVTEHLHILDELTAGKLPTEVITFLQRKLQCYPIGKFEKVELTDCTKVNVGLQCNIYLEIYTSDKSYDHYLTINHLRVELDIGQPTNKLVKSSNQSPFTLLSCKNTTDSQTQVCESEPWDNDCSSIIDTTDYHAISKKCNFTIKKPPPPMVTDQGGILVMNKKYNINLLRDNVKIKAIENLSPLLIFSQFIVSLLHGTEEINFQPSQQILIEKIIYSGLNATIISLFKSKALQRAIKNLDWMTLLQYGALFVHIAIFPIALVSCAVSLKALHAFRPLRNSINLIKKSVRSKEDIPMQRKVNFLQNKKITKKVLSKK